VKVSNIVYSLLIVVAAVATVVAQTPATSTAPPDTSATGTSSEVQKTLEEILEEPTTTDTYRYDPQGRRDPFRSLIGPTPKLEPGQRPPGVPGFLIDEMKLQGVFKTRSADRPNPIGLHPVEVVAVEGNRIRVRNLEALDGTPIIDVKPVLPATRT